MHRIKEIREKKGMTIKQLAESADIAENTLAYFEKKDHSVLQKMESVAAVLGVSPAYLCGWSDDKSERVVVHKTVVEQTVVQRVYQDATRIPPCWQAEGNQIVRWMRGGKPV